MTGKSDRPPPPPRGRGWRGRPRAEPPPDILYHATTVSRAGRARSTGVLEVSGGRPVYLSRSEGQAWQVAHRQAEAPSVLYVDVARARRDGCRFERNRHGLWQCRSVPVRHVLNLSARFAEQISAGGIPLWNSPEGPKLALIRVRRAHSTTWEIAKGKLEAGEAPYQAAMREVQEEMGCCVDFRIVEDLGSVRFGFYTPAGDPRLKTLYVYLLETDEQISEFHPSHREGIQEVGWFTPREAARVVAHRSLKPLMRQVRRLLEEDSPFAEGDAGAEDGDSEEEEGEEEALIAR